MKRILHIEDDAENRLLVRKILEAHGYQVIDASDGLMGARLAIEKKPDLILVDLNLPELDGYEVTLKLRGEPSLKDIPIVAITAQGDKRTSLAVGCDGFILKPIEIESFIKTINRFIKGHKEEEQVPHPDVYLKAQSRKTIARLETKINELTRANKRLKELDHLKSEFIRNISHELSTPLTPIIGYLNLLLNEKIGPLNQMQYKSLKSIETCTNRLKFLIDNLLAITMLEAGEIYISEKECDWGELARRAIKEQQKMFQEKEIKLHSFLPPKGECISYGDPEKLLTMMGNLLNNAAKFANKQGEVFVRIKVLDGAYTEFSVFNSGEGIPKDQLEKIFDLFYQIDGSSTRKYQGAGLGLGVTKKMVELLGGKIWAESPPEEKLPNLKMNTKVTFVLPNKIRSIR